MKLIQVNFSDYYREKFAKTQIYLHHTAGADNGKGVFSWWGRTQTRVATCVIINRNGDIMQGYSSKYWAYHLGLKSATFKAFGLRYMPLDRSSIGIEITNWGGLTKKKSKYYNYLGGEVKKEDVIELDFKGYKYYHNYTDAQIAAVSELLALWEGKYNIKAKYNKDIFKVCQRALKGESGVYTHNSVREDKNDVYPHPKLIEMLKAL